MGIHARRIDNQLHSPICKHCSQYTWEYEGLDRENEVADVQVLYCENDYCPIVSVDWAAVVKEFTECQM